jgi:hypothetical protein
MLEFSMRLCPTVHDYLVDAVQLCLPASMSTCNNDNHHTINDNDYRDYN